jgi:hypothetical protein
MDLQRIAKKAMDVGYGIDPDNLPRSCSITRTTGQTYDPVTDTYTGGETVTHTFRAVRGQYATRDIDGTVIQTGDMRLKVAQAELDITPDIGETVTVNDTDWQIVDRRQDAVEAVVTLQVRK